MDSYGKGIIKGLSVTFKRFFESYLEDFRWIGKKYTPEKTAFHSSKDTRGTFTIEYPEQKLPVPEEFRYVPFLVYDEGANGEKNIRCTSFEGLPASMHLDRAHQRSRHGTPGAPARGILHRCGYLHELRILC
jgi:hypothetical protein